MKILALCQLLAWTSLGFKISFLFFIKIRSSNFEPKISAAVLTEEQFMGKIKEKLGHGF